MKKEKAIIDRNTSTVMMPPYVYASESDLTLGDEDLELCLDVLGLNDFLHLFYGFCKEYDYKKDGVLSDISDTEDVHKDCKFYGKEFCVHRNKSGQVVECHRFIGRERTDKEWLENGNPSDELLVAVRDDISYIHEINKLKGLHFDE